MKFCEKLSVDSIRKFLLNLLYLNYFQEYKESFKPKATPSWFYNSFDQAVANGEDLSWYKNRTLEHIKDIVTRYKGKNTNYKVFNEVIHGELYRFEIKS